MKKIFFFLFAIAVLTPLKLQAAHCTKCGGTGWMTIFHSLATYGHSNQKQQCHICGRWFPLGLEHKERCTACGGSGHIQSSSDRINAERNSRNNDLATDALSYLNSAELTQYMALQEMLNGHKEPVPCQTCNTTGRCIACNNPSFNVAGYCTLCAGTMRCRFCGGTGISGSRFVQPQGEERQRILMQMGQILARAQQRGHQ